jgi:DNA-binding transcriptional regulator YbjK
MPANPERRVLITDTAIEILAEVGAGGLSHRTVDTRAGLPPGTTSNFFRTRLALLQATAQRVAELHWCHVAEVQERIGRPKGRAAVAVLLGHMLTTSDEPSRLRNLARIELFLASNRWPELRPIMDDVHAAAMRTAAVVLESAGLTPPPERLVLLSRLLSGLLFEQVSRPTAALTPDAATALVGRLLDLVL